VRKQVVFAFRGELNAVDIPNSKGGYWLTDAIYRTENALVNEQAGGGFGGTAIGVLAKPLEVWSVLRMDMSLLRWEGGTHWHRDRDHYRAPSREHS
jgi:hypothetical protein